MAVKHGELSYRVIGCAMEVHTALGPGLDERFYHKALCEALGHAGIAHQYKARTKLFHRGLVADEFEPDLIADDRLILELKSLSGKFAAAHWTQLICYLKFWGLDLGILLDFGKESLVQKRVAYSPIQPPTSVASMLDPDGPEGLSRPVADSFSRVLQTVYDEHGLGYRDTTYRGLVAAELHHQGIPFTQEPTVALSYAGRALGDTGLQCFSVQDQYVLQVLALREHTAARDRAVLQSYGRHLGCSVGVLVNFGKRRLEVRTVHM